MSTDKLKLCVCINLKLSNFKLMRRRNFEYRWMVQVVKSLLYVVRGPGVDIDSRDF